VDDQGQERYPKDWYPKMHAEAEALKKLLNNRPDLFID